MPANRVPLREYLFRFAGPLIGAVIGVVIVLTVFPHLFGERARVPYWVWIVTAVVVLVLTVGASAVGLLVGQRLVGDRIEGALREPGGKWRHGRIVVDGTDVIFESYRLQMRIPSGQKERLNNATLGPDTGQRPSLRKLWTVNPQLHIVTLNSTQGHFEFGALPSRINLFRERLQGRERQ